MKSQKDFELFSGERVEVSLRPHPLSFLKYYSACLYLAFLAAAFHRVFQWFHQNVWSNLSIARILNLLFGIVPGLNPEELVSLIIF